MLVKRVSHCIRRALFFGAVRTMHIVKQRCKTKYFQYCWYQKKERVTWRTIQHDFNLKNTHAHFFNEVKNRELSFLKNVFDAVDDTNELCSYAEKIVEKKFSILGSPLEQFDEMPWFCDIRYAQQQKNSGKDFDAHSWYKDITIQTHDTLALGPDIKIPWELSRLQHLLVLGFAYHKTSDERYAYIFKEQLEEWLSKNHFLRGINWLCPMEVGLRACNIVYALEFFKHSAQLPSDFFERLTSSLYEHFIYLEHNWELYDSRTSNHYLSDLIGYLALCWYFKKLPAMHKKIAWCLDELEREWHKQILPDGTSYEGSTAYHRLVTEIFTHAYLMRTVIAESNCQQWPVRLQKMYRFIDDCTLDQGAFITIGDNDSGSVIAHHFFSALRASALKNNAPSKAEQQALVSTAYEHFGLALIRTNSWHVLLRKHTYSALQPSGHFHNDWGSITVGVHGIPLLVDPGSYVYTASAPWRNMFRSVEAHNSFGVESIEPIPLTEKLFYLDIPEERHNRRTQESVLCAQSEHELYKEHNLKACRYIMLDQKNQEFTITDSWKSSDKGAAVVPLFVPTVWHFMVDPAISPVRNGMGWEFIYKGKIIAHMASSDLIFSVQPGWFSPAYGVKVATNKLQARQLLPLNSSVRIKFLTIC